MVSGGQGIGGREGPERPRSCRRHVVAMIPYALVLALTLPTQAAAPVVQKAPEVGYVYPPGGKAGTTVDVKLGGYDWTPDLQYFVLDPRAKLEILGPPGPILVPRPPYWFGAKSFLKP